MSETDPKSGRRWTLGLGLIIPAMVVIPLWFFMIGPNLRHDKLVEKGIRSPGRLLAVEETGTVINDVPKLELTMEITRKDGTLDTAVTDFVPTLRTLHMYQPGIAITAAYDPEDPDEVTVVELSSGPPTTLIGQPSPDRVVDSLRHAADSLAEELRRMKAGR